MTGSSRVPGRRRSAVSVAMIAVLLAVLVPGASAAPQGQPGPRRVLVVSMPRLTWAEVQHLRPRVLSRFLGAAAVASMSTRTVGPRTDSADAYLSIGAGNRADSLTSSMPGDAANATESTPNGPAVDVYRRRTGIRPRGAVLALSIAQQISRNEELLYGAKPGALASALAAAGRRVAVVGNADPGIDASVRQREIALAGMSEDGQVALGDVSDSLLVGDPRAPFGVRTDADAVVSAVQRGWGDASVQFVEMSDLERADEARVESTAEEGDRQFAAALRRSDAVLARLLASVDVTRDVVMVVAPTAPMEAEQLTVFGMRGPGIGPGWAHSPTTRRSGFVTLTDIAPTILDAWNIDPPSSMNDTPIVAVRDGRPLSARLDTMVRDGDRALFRDDVTSPVTVAFIVVLVLLLLAVMLAVGRVGDRWRGVLRWLALAVIAAPTAMYLSGLVPYGPFDTATFVLAIAGASLLLAAVSMLSVRWDPIAPPVVLCAAAIAVLGVDVVTGANLQLNTPFGYSPIVAGRFAGFGNQAFSILTISALIVVTAGWEMWRRRRPGSSDVGRTAFALAVFLVVIVLDGSPNWGSDVGGVISTIPAFAVCVLLLLGRRIRLRLVAVIGACTVGVLVVLAAFDMSRPVDARTHLGRFAQKLLDGGGSIILQRKLEANMSILTSTIWTIVIPFSLLFIAYLTWRPNRLLRRLHRDHFGFRPFGIAGLTLGVVAWAVNDSGVSIPALMLTVALPYTAYLVLGLSAQRADGEADAEDFGAGPSMDRGAVPVGSGPSS